MDHSLVQIMRIFYRETAKSCLTEASMPAVVYSDNDRKKKRDPTIAL